MEIKYGGLSWRGDQYANISVDIDVLNELKYMTEDLIVDYARVKNFDGIKEAIASRDEILGAIEEITPEPIPETEEQTDEEALNRDLHGCLYGGLLAVLLHDDRSDR